MKIYPTSAEFARKAYLNAEPYQSVYEQSIKTPIQFWEDQAASIWKGADPSIVEKLIKEHQ